VATGIPKSPPLFVVVQAAETKVNLVPVGIVPPEIFAVISRFVFPGTIEDIFTNKSEFDVVAAAAPAVEVVSDKVMGA